MAKSCDKMGPGLAMEDSWENQRTESGIFQQAVFDGRGAMMSFGSLSLSLCHYLHGCQVEMKGRFFCASCKKPHISPSQQASRQSYYDLGYLEHRGTNQP